MATYGIGAILRAERTRQGLSVDDVARKTKISPRFLTGIEEEDFDVLPGLVFARGFIRQYSNLLNLDSESLLAKFPKPDMAAMPMPEVAQRVPLGNIPARAETEWDPRWNSMISSTLWFVLALGAAIGAYVYFNRSNPALTPQTVAQRQSESAKPAGSETSETAKAPIVAAATPPPNGAAEQPSNASSSPANGPSTDSAAGKSVKVVLTANEPTWISITADGEAAFAGTLQTDESKTVSADTQVKLVAGNAGGLKIQLNGKELEPLGPRGQVRTVRLTADGPQLLSKTPSAPKYDPL